MISYTSGDILKADAEALVNTVNCVGVMGRGIALQFKNAFPENFGAYARACQKKEVLPGKMFVYRTGTLTTPYFIINFPTKRHWRGKSRLEDIDSGLQAPSPFLPWGAAWAGWTGRWCGLASKRRWRRWRMSPSLSMSPTVRRKLTRWCIVVTSRP